jgi:cell division inhibitor SulA
MQQSVSLATHPMMINPTVMLSHSGTTLRKSLPRPLRGPQQAANTPDRNAKLKAKLQQVLSHPDTARGWVLLLGVSHDITKAWFTQLGLDNRRVVIVYAHQLQRQQPPTSAVIRGLSTLNTGSTYELWLRQSLTNATFSVVIDASSQRCMRASLGQSLSLKFGVRYITLPAEDSSIHDLGRTPGNNQSSKAVSQTRSLKATKIIQPCSTPNVTQSPA